MGLTTIAVQSELRIIRTICDGEAELQGKIEALVKAAHFASPVGRELFDRITMLRKGSKPIPKADVLALDSAISENARDTLRNSGGLLCSNMEDALSVVNQLEDFRQLRVIYIGAKDIVDSLNNSSGSVEIKSALSAMERAVINARSSLDEDEFIISGHDSNARPVVDRVLSLEKPDRIMTGFSEFDAATGGFARKDLVLVAANTGGGKSVMAEELGINSYYRTGQNRNVALVSFEMDEEEIYARLMSNLTDIPFETIYMRRWSDGESFQDYAAALAEGKRGSIIERCEQAWGQFNKHGEILGNRFMVWCPTIDVTPNQIGAILAPSGFDLVLIDYVGLVAAERQADLWENLGSITRDFKNVARRNDCVVAVMAQMDEETNKIKYSKAMRHHSSYVWKWSYGDPEAESGLVKIEQDKARHCKKFPFTLRADFSTMAFRNLDDGKEERPDRSSKSENIVGQKGEGEAETKESVPELIARGAKRKEQSDFASAAQHETYEKFSQVTRSLSNLAMAELDEGDL